MLMRWVQVDTEIKRLKEEEDRDVAVFSVVRPITCVTLMCRQRELT